MIATSQAPSIREHWHRHEGADIFVAGFGGSLAVFDWHRLDGKIVIALNDAITLMPWATYHLYADGMLYSRYWTVPYGKDTTIVIQPEGTHRIVSALDWPHLAKVRMFTRQNCAEIPWSPRDSDDLWVNSTVATAGIMLAWKLGAYRVCLLGLDGYMEPGKPYYADGRLCPEGWGNWYAVTLDDGRTVQIQHRHIEWARDMEKLAEHFRARAEPTPEVWNLNPLSTIQAWPKKRMEEVL